MSDPVSLESAWARLSIHLEWANSFWLLFVFTDDADVSRQLRERAQTQLEAAGREVVELRPRSPDDANVVQALLAGGGDRVAWVDYARHDAPGQSDWRHAWEKLCAQLNERREVLRREWGTGGIVLVTTLDRLDDTPGVAPDLWTIRALLLRVAATPVEPFERPRLESIELREPKSTRDVELDRQAVARTRRKYADGGALADLALALRNLSESLAGIGERDEALAAAQESVDHYRKLAREQPEAFGPRLAAALNDLGERLYRVGRWEHALVVAQEAVAILRELAEINLETYAPELGRALYRLSNYMGIADQLKEAVAAAQESVTLFQALARLDPAKFRPRLMSALWSLSNRLKSLGHTSEALTNSTEALTIARDLAHANPSVYLPDLAQVLVVYAGALAAAGNHADALTTLQEAVSLFRSLATAYPTLHLPNLGMALVNIVPLYIEKGQHDRGRAAAVEAVQTFRELAAAHPEAYRDTLIRALSNLGVAERLPAAKIEATSEAIGLLQEMPHTNSNQQDMLAAALTNLGNELDALGRSDDAKAASERSVDIYRALAETNSNAFTPKLAHALRGLGARYDKSGESLLARDHYAEALSLILPHFVEHPAAFGFTTAKLALNLERLQDKHGAGIPDALAPVVEHIINVTRPGPPEWTEAELAPIWQFISLDATPEQSPDIVEPAESAKPYILRWVTILATLAALLIIAKFCA